MIRVTIVSPNPALRIGLRELLSDNTDINVTGESADLDELDLMSKKTEVLILASVSPFPELEEESPAILLLTDDFEDVQLMVGKSERVWGALSPQVGEDELVAAIKALGEGLWVGSPALVKGLMNISNQIELVNEGELPEPLTPREIEVLQLVTQGLANKQVALSLNISEHTVKFHLSSLFSKLNAASRTEAVRVGLSMGLISL
ncbi:MAG: response regulator transcription factor [Anaerolineae bacterium]|nr:response regulator transcription factor [Anaerolineae bacterium]MDK1079921.1 response regulator transcription factor [Anaerolineae bacterium]